jgi:RluA family pseudouridine synthase
VHRLDRDTSGVVVFALTREAHKALNAIFEGRRAEKTYLALVRGDLSEPGKIDLPLAETRRGQMRVARPAEKSALAALTEVNPTERFGSYTLCTCLPRTGRTHQIRVHLAAIGHALAVDPRYGDDRPLRIGELWRGAPDPDTVVLSRTPLHASALRIPHPMKRGWLEVESPLADDMARCLDLLRAARRES